MSTPRTILGMLIVIMGVYFTLFILIELGIVVIAIGSYFLFTGVRTPSHRQISGQVNQVIYNSLKERGLERIKTGQLRTSEERLISVLDKLRDILGSQNDMPELGYDALFFHFRSETEAAGKLAEITERGLHGSLIQNKSEWQIKVDL
ncbi:MAG: hypothetical protein M1431_03740 [Candidatus Thermoplasmatota archaeon]|nr:hypothetical protein [Candidatus Thermoplasmatota archaeon]